MDDQLNKPPEEGTKPELEAGPRVEEPLEPAGVEEKMGAAVPEGAKPEEAAPAKEVLPKPEPHPVGQRGRDTLHGSGSSSGAVSTAETGNPPAPASHPPHRPSR